MAESMLTIHADQQGEFMTSSSDNNTPPRPKSAVIPVVQEETRLRKYVSRASEDRFQGILRNIKDGKCPECATLLPSRRREKVHARQHITIFVCRCSYFSRSRDTVVEHQRRYLQPEEMKAHGGPTRPVYEVDAEHYALVRSTFATRLPVDFPHLGSQPVPTIKLARIPLVNRARRSPATTRARRSPAATRARRSPSPTRARRSSLTNRARRSPSPSWAMRPSLADRLGPKTDLQQRQEEVDTAERNVTRLEGLLARARQQLGERQDRLIATELQASP